MTVTLSGWHPGERAIQARLNIDGPMAMAYTLIEPAMPEQHQVFHTRNLPFIPLTTLDARGRPWSSLVASASGLPGFVSSPSETELVMNLDLWPGDPILNNLDLLDESKACRLLVAGLGIEFPTRRRNKFAGYIYRVDKTGDLSRRIRLRVNQAIGNCPKYINVRDLVPHPRTSPRTVHRSLQMSSKERLPEDLIKFILESDTVFLGTSYIADSFNKFKYPSHVGMNARGGRAGFIRVLPSDGRTLILPDYSGNRLTTSLGNIEVTSLASMSFLDFGTGDILYLTGTAKNVVGPDAQKIMPRQNVFTTLHVEGFIFIRDALPVRQRPNTSVGRSPYSPPVKYVAEEKDGQSTHLLDDVSVTLTRVDVLSPTLATFTFEASAPVHIRAGQAAVLDFADLLGTQRYAHMAARGHEARINDDRIRTWTVSSAHAPWRSDALVQPDDAREARRARDWRVVCALRQAAAKMPEVLIDARPLGLRVGLVGIAGSFTLPEPSDAKDLKLLWIAGGIGVTPYISMLASMSHPPTSAGYDVVFVLSTREPDVLLRLIQTAVPKHATLKVILHLFTSQAYDASLLEDCSALTLVHHQGRLDSTTETRLSSLVTDAKERLVYLCGPPAFEESTMEALSRTGVNPASVVREGFSY
ncbi:hypothetical protein DFH11DRAFT_1544191 [Phellopilus nigrolimitatus]|nr:hypothetical protein DFH11DRAFT_1544191 [Phellopilus nigrolimitatus]